IPRHTAIHGSTRSAFACTASRSVWSAVACHRFSARPAQPTHAKPIQPSPTKSNLIKVNEGGPSNLAKDCGPGERQWVQSESCKRPPSASLTHSITSCPWHGQSDPRQPTPGESNLRQPTPAASHTKNSRSDRAGESSQSVPGTGFGIQPAAHL